MKIITHIDQMDWDLPTVHEREDGARFLFIAQNWNEAHNNMKEAAMQLLCSYHFNTGNCMEYYKNQKFCSIVKALLFRGGKIIQFDNESVAINCWADGK